GQCAGQAEQDTEQIAEKESDHDNPDHGNHKSFQAAVEIKHENNHQIGKPKLNSVDRREKGDQGFHVSQENSQSRTQSQYGCFTIHIYLPFRMSPYRESESLYCRRKPLPEIPCLAGR